MFRLLLNISRNGHPVTSLSNLCQRSVTLIGRAFCVCLHLLPLVLSLGSTEEPECLCEPVLQVCMYIGEIPLSLSFQLNSSSCFSLSSQERYSSPCILMTLFWTLSSSSVSLALEEDLDTLL